MHGFSAQAQTLPGYRSGEIPDWTSSAKRDKISSEQNRRSRLFFVHDMKFTSKRCLGLIVAILLGILVSSYLFTTNIFSFLSPNAPIKAQILVIEGWLPDYALKKASDHFSSTPYELIVVTGGPLRNGTFLSEYNTYAELGCATLSKITDRRDIIAVPAPPVKKDRTYASALALRTWLEDNRMFSERINVVSLGVHARRTWYLFDKVLSDGYSIGIISIDNDYYEGHRWWRSSSGFKMVLLETLAYAYTRLFFPFADDLSGN